MKHGYNYEIYYIIKIAGDSISLNEYIEGNIDYDSMRILRG